MFAPMRYPRGQTTHPWRLVHMQAEVDPSASEYGLLDSALADEAELPREGLLSQVGTEGPGTLKAGELTILARRPATPGAEMSSALAIPRHKPPLPTASVPFALRDRTLEMPIYLPKNHRHEWGLFHQELRRVGMPSEMEIDLARTMFGYEGGMEPNRDNGAVGGITQTYLDRAAEHGVLPNKKTTALSLNEVARLYRAYFKDAMNSVSVANPISRIPDKKAAGQMIDLLFMEDKKGGRLIQQVMNELISSLPDHIQHQLGVDQVKEDGDIGDVTYTRFNRLLNAGFGTRLRNDIANRAIDYFTNKPGGLPGGIKERMDQYR